MRTEKFNKPFKKDQVLSHTELNNITDAVDDVIDVLSSLDEGDHTLTDAQIEAEIKNRTDQIKDQIDDAVADLNNVIDQLSEDLDGNTTDLVKAKNAIGLIVQSDEHGDTIKRAAIVAAINEDGNSIAGIQADKIVLDGDVTTSGTLTTLDAEIANIRAAKADVVSLDALQATVHNLNVPTTAEITNAVIERIEAGNVTITGDLRYNRLIGNVTEAVGTITLEDGAYFVDIKQPTSDSEIVNLTMPTNPTKGQIVYIMNMENANSIVANVPMAIYYINRDQNDVPSLNTERISANTPINPVQREMGNQVTQFLFDGGKWIQLNAPFVSYNITRS